MAVNPTRSELKITIAQLLEVVYSKDKGVMTKIAQSKGPFKLTVDQDGNARLSSKFGILDFSGSLILDKIGANIKYVTVNFSHGGGNIVNYEAIFDLKVAKFAIRGNFDIVTVNGFEHNGDPLALYLEYKSRNGLWLVNYIYLSFLENKDGFLHKAICPIK